MTREEAIKVIEIIEKRFITLDKEERQALILAIKALEQESCEDAISREAVLDKLENLDWQELYLPIHFKRILDSLPSVTPKVVECDDAISRVRVVEWLQNCTDDSIEHAIDSNIEFIPSVTPQQKMGRCKDCKYFEYDSTAIVDGIPMPLIVAHEICSKWGRGCKTKEDGYCFLYEPRESEDKE